MKDREELTTGEESGRYMYDFNPQKDQDLFHRFLDYQDKGGSLSIDKWQEEVIESEEKAKTSLYNLLDHSESDLNILIDMIELCEKELFPVKDLAPQRYGSVCAWLAIAKTAKMEVSIKDSNRWADNATQEIKETLNQK